MDIYGLIGPSGTGKSHRANLVAHNNNIPLIIDDGLLIWDGKILGGKSSKREETKLAAIRRALFYDKEQVKEVKERIKYTNENKILILGTSLRMVKRIIENLGLPDLLKIIKIYDIATKEEIKTAKRIRIREGKHVIPVPTIEVKSKFPAYLLNPLELFLKKDKEPIEEEESIVRPKFSYYGKLIVSDKVIIEMVNYLLKKEKVIKKFFSPKIEENNEGIKIDLKVELIYGVIIPEYIYKVQLLLKRNIERLIGVEILNINVEVNSLYYT